MIDQAVIFCGGFGTRLLPLTKKIPKPMVKLDNKPFLFHLIMQCKSNGINNFLILCGYKAKIIEKYFGNGSRLGVKIKYHYNPPHVQTLKRLIDANKLLTERFLLMYSDNYSDLNLHQLKEKFIKFKSSFLLSICKKKKGNVLINTSKKKLRKYYFKKNNKSNYVEIGYMIIKKKILPKYISDSTVSFNSFINTQTNKNKINYFINENNYISISDKKRFLKAKEYFNNKPILVDRDGVLNLKSKSHYYIRNKTELEINFKFLKRYGKLLKKKKVFCITNQAGIATGDLTKKNLNLINKEIKKSLKKQNIQIVDFFVSPHHFKSKHIDRKPGNGLFLKAVKKYKFLLDRSIYIGDDIRDIEASYNAKCKCIYIGKEKLNTKEKNKYKYILTK